MALMRVMFRAPSLEKQTNMTVILPYGAEAEGPYPVLYLLHGLSDDDSIWARRTSLERHVAGMPLIVVMPDGGRGFYTDAQQGPAWESHIMEDVVGFVEHFFPAIPERRGRAVEGLSMGGYGAMKLALKYPERFCSAAAHSSALAVEKRLSDGERAAEFRLIFGPEPPPREDPFRLAERADPDALPALRVDCGTEDGLLEENRAFHRHLEDLGIPHEYEEFPGGHDWAYWDRRVQEALKFHSRVLDI